MFFRVGLTYRIQVTDPPHRDPTVIIKPPDHPISYKTTTYSGQWAADACYPVISWA
jgi:hypothetical protein